MTMEENYVMVFSSQSAHDQNVLARCARLGTFPSRPLRGVYGGENTREGIQRA